MSDVDDICRAIEAGDMTEAEFAALPEAVQDAVREQLG